jgi:hypothetical protein
VASLKTDTSILKWMMGFVLAFQVAIFAKLFLEFSYFQTHDKSKPCYHHGLCKLHTLYL